MNWDHAMLSYISEAVGRLTTGGIVFCYLGWRFFPMTLSFHECAVGRAVMYMPGPHWANIYGKNEGRRVQAFQWCRHRPVSSLVFEQLWLFLPWNLICGRTLASLEQMNQYIELDYASVATSLGDPPALREAAAVLRMFRDVTTLSDHKYLQKATN